MSDGLESIPESFVPKEYLDPQKMGRVLLIPALLQDKIILRHKLYTYSRYGIMWLPQHKSARIILEKFVEFLDELIKWIKLVECQ